jgi:hypothetical protein
MPWRQHHSINHTVVIKDERLREDPTLAPRLFDTFKAAKEVLIQRLDAGVELSDAEQALAQRRHLVGADPLPYGLAANESALEAVIQFAVDQHILPHHVNLKDVFAGSTLELA